MKNIQYGDVYLCPDGLVRRMDKIDSTAIYFSVLSRSNPPEWIELELDRDRRLEVQFENGRRFSSLRALKFYQSLVAASQAHE